MTTKRKGAPRREFDQKVADTICRLIVEGQSLKRICAMKRMPGIDTVMRWLEETPSFGDQYARAREEQAEGYADQLIELSRKANSKNAHAIRVQVDVIKWVCSKLKPKKYGDRLELAGQVDVGASGGSEKALADCTREERVQRAKRLVFDIAMLGRELRDTWHQEELGEGCAFLGDKIWERIVDGSSAEESQAPAPAPVAPPRALLPAPAPEPRIRVINPWPEDESPPFAPSREEMGLK